VSLLGFASRIESVRRSFTLTSLFIAALSVTWSATPVAAAGLPIHAAFSATSEHVPSTTPAQTGTRAESTTLGSLPAQLGAFPGGGELAAIAAVGSSGNTAVTTPADPSLAAGPSNVVEAVNSALFVYARTGGTPTVFGINTMINNPVSTGWAARYPHVVYDPVSGRFILMVLEFDTPGCGSQIVIMESQANPALPWIARGTLSIDSQLAPPPSGRWVLADVSLALTGTLLVESSDYQSCTSGTLGALAASQTDEIQRADLVGGTMTVNSVAFQAGGPVGVQPVMGLGLTGVAFEIANDANCTGVQASTVAVFTINGAPDSHNVAIGCSAGTSSFAETFGSSTPSAAPQGGTSITLQTHDDRFLSAVWENNVLWAAGNTGCATGACLNVVHATAMTTGAVSAGSQLTPEGVSGSYLYYPSLAVDTVGDVIVTFDESGSIPDSIMLGSITGGTTWSSSFTTVATSADFYSPGGCTSCLWGDYSAAVQDALHPTDVWVASSYVHGDTGTGCATVNSCWNTYVARYTFALPSVSSLTPSSGPGGGGESVLVSGSDFANPTTATIGGTPLTLSNVTPDSFMFTTPPGSGIENVIASDSLGPSTATPASAYLYIPLSNYVPVTPFRVLDTRHTGGPLGPGVTRPLQVTVGTVPINATAAVLNVTEVSGSASSLLTVYPFNTPRPTASNLNFGPGTVIANLVTVTLGASSGGGWIDIYNALGSVNVIVDVEGYFSTHPATTFDGLFHPILPVRVCDTRTSCEGHTAVGSGQSIVVTVPTAGGVPADGTAGSAVVNITGVAGNASTYLSLFPTDASGHCNPTGTSTMNLLPGVVRANRVMVRLGPTGAGRPADALCVFNAVGTINVLVDVNGWYGSTTASATQAGYQYQALGPTRICDTRIASTSCATGAISAGTALQRLITVAGHGGVPAFGSGPPVVAIIANLTAIAPTATTYLTLFPASLTGPGGVSDLNIGAGAVLPNLAVVEVDTVASNSNDGDVFLYNGAGSVNAILDLEGWFQ
jgi:IPT/TIG domain